jgi:class 3 adenylate cyclase
VVAPLGAAVGDPDPLLGEIAEFLTGARGDVDPDRTLSTVLFTDIVGSTTTADRVGDREWRNILDSHHGAVRASLSRFGGVEIDTAGDGFLATFAGLAVHVGARVAALAAASEVLVTSVVRALVLGSGLSFVDRGVHSLKGVPDTWQLFAVA